MSAEKVKLRGASNRPLPTPFLSAFIKSWSWSRITLYRTSRATTENSDAHYTRNKAFADINLGLMV